MEAVPPHVLLGADVVFYVQASVEDGVLLRRPTEPGEPLVQGSEHNTRHKQRHDRQIHMNITNISDKWLILHFFPSC